MAVSSRVSTGRAAGARRAGRRAALRPSAMAAAVATEAEARAKDAQLWIDSFKMKVGPAGPSVKLVPAAQTTAQKLACMSYTPSVGYVAWYPAKIEFTKESIVVGSDPRPGSGVDVVVGVATVSAEHAKFTIGDDGSTITVEDLKSANGTFIDGEKVSGATQLAPGQVLSLDTTRGINYKVEVTSAAEREAYAAKAGSPAMFSEASREDRVPERTAWIAAWKARMA